jgi:hypothetical protein
MRTLPLSSLSAIASDHYSSAYRAWVRGRSFGLAV